MIVRNVYVLTRNGEGAPLNEPARGADLTGDGDELDSNNVFGVALRDGDYMPLWKVVSVTVPSDYASIDTHADETMADYRAASDVFTVDAEYRITPIEGRVDDFSIGEVLVDCPLQSREGRL